MKYVCVPLFKEVSGTSQIGQVLVFRTIPVLSQNLTFMDFNSIIMRNVDFCVGFLLTIDIKKRAETLLRLSQTPETPK